jgi:NhaP-type Na+/H+ or K+/H+ antiporter
MNSQYLVAALAVSLVGYAVVSRRLERTVVTGPMLAVAVGLAIGPGGLDLMDADGLFGRVDVVSLVLTGALVVVLFTDAGAINSGKWRDDVIPARLLGIGLPVSLLLGWVAALVLLGDLELWEAAVLGAMLAPTDAALGKAVVSNPRVPLRIRQALNIESGLNDGITLPFFLVFLETAEAVDSSLSIADLVAELVRQVGVALAVGIAAGWLGARALDWGRRRDVASHHWLQVGVVAIAVAAYSLATPLGGSGFIAAWVAGLMFGRVVRSTPDPDPSLPVFAETLGDVLTLGSFLLLGVYLDRALSEVTWEIAVYAALSLTVVRMVPVAVAMAGRHMQRSTVLYMGWFGPRGLATLILTIEVVDRSELPGAATIGHTALLTVAASVVLHGATAWWGSNAYADAVADAGDGAGLAEQDTSVLEVRVPLRAQHRPVAGSVSPG